MDLAPGPRLWPVVREMENWCSHRLSPYMTWDRLIMTIRQQIWFWVALIATFLVLTRILTPILLPFVAGLAVAYFLDPVADRLEAIGLSRVMSTSIITFIFFIVLVLSVFLLVPLIAGQAVELADAAPDYITQVKAFTSKLIEGPLGRFISDSQDGATADALDGLRQKALEYGTGVLQDLARGGAAVLNFIGLIFITPVVSFYLLNDWDRIVAYVDKLLPRQQADTIRGLAKEIDKVLAGFVRGMGTICVLLAIFYAVALELAGLKFGLVVGIIAGLVSFIPFVGMAVGLILSLVLALFQFMPDEPVKVAIVFGIFIFGQILEGNVLTPKLVGKQIGLHPVWVIFGLLAFGSLFGFVGMLLAVPVAAAIGVIVRYFTSQYLKSPLYWGAGASVGSDLVLTEGSSEAASLAGLETKGANGQDDEGGTKEEITASESEDAE
jgi:predicted PurR-regulated permease PerM